MSRRVDHRLVRVLAQAQISHCSTCRPDCAEWVSDILDELRVPAHLHGYTCRDLTCPKCEIGLWPNTWIERHDPEDRPHMLFVARSALKYGQRLSDFHDFLCRFPYLGSEHPLGVAMRRSISTFPVLTLRNQHWLRARRGSGEIAGMSSENMWAPDPTIHPVHQGRYNHEGQAVLYLSEDLETAVAEVFDRPSGEKEGTVAIEEFNIVSLERVLDVTGASSRSLLYAALVYEGHLSRALENSSMWKPEYFVPRFVADLARFKGLNGILYRTSKTFCATGLNLVVFNPRREDFRADGHPKIYGRSAHRQSIGLGDAEIVSYVITPHSTA